MHSVTECSSTIGFSPKLDTFTAPSKIEVSSPVNHISTHHPMKELFEQIKKFLLLGLDFILADPSDRERIATLQAENARLIQELAEAHADDLTEEQKTELSGIFNQYALATAPVPAPTTDEPAPEPEQQEEAGEEAEPEKEA